MMPSFLWDLHWSQTEHSAEVLYILHSIAGWASIGWGYGRALPALPHFRKLRLRKLIAIDCNRELFFVSLSRLCQLRIKMAKPGFKPVRPWVCLKCLRPLDHHSPVDEQVLFIFQNYCLNFLTQTWQPGGLVCYRELWYAKVRPFPEEFFRFSYAWAGSPRSKLLTLSLYYYWSL